MNIDKSNLIECIDFEISSICNAGCSVCMRRRDGHYSEFKQTYWTIDEVKRAIDIDIIKNLKNLILCGNFGDAMGNPDIVKIAEYFRLHNSNLPIHINTNGGIGDVEKYEQLGKMGIEMTFGLDGIGEANELYRVNVKWENVIRNLTAFTKNCKPNHLEIQFIMWSETTNQIIPMIDLIKEIGFGRLFLRKPYTTGLKTEVYNMNGESTHFLTEVENEDLNPYLETFWDYSKIDILREELSNINLQTKQLEISNFIIKPKRTFPPKPYEYSEVNFNEHDNENFKKITKQTCYSKNFKNPSNLLENHYNIYITHDKLLMPCCMIPPNISNSIHHHTTEETPYQKEILNRMLELGFENFSLQNKTLKELFNSDILDKFVYIDLENNTQFKMCKTICGKCN